MPVITVKSRLRDYTVTFETSPDFLASLRNDSQVCYAIDSTVWNLYKSGYLQPINPSAAIVVPIDEELKTLSTVQLIYDRLLERSAKKNLTLISIGGGILQDVSGFAASTLYRGINWIFVPTTLLAQADSCIGGKTSLNYESFKNLVGTFYPPSQVAIYTPFLATQEDRDYLSGLGEIVKLHMIGGTDSLDTIVSLLPALLARDQEALGSAIRASLLIKRDFIVDDEFDTGRRNLLNFGHCFGHALESAARYEIPHGQAVTVGMILANLVAIDRGILSDKFHRRLLQDLLLPALSVTVKADHLAQEPIVAAMKKDKKRVGKGLALIMMGDGCEMFRVNDLSEAEVAKALALAVDILDAE